MSLRLGRTALIALALIGPATSFAHTDAAIDACVQAFLSSDVAKGRKVTVRTPAAYSYTPRPLLLTSRSTVQVVAKGRDSGKQIARIVCETNGRGEIITVHGRPAAAIPALAAAR